MNLSATVLALSALYQAADAFVVQAPKTFGTNLHMSSGPNYGGARSPQNYDGSSKRSVRSPEQMAPPSPSYSVNGSLSKAPEISPMSRKTTQEIFDEIQPVTVQGGSLRTCSFSEKADRVSVYLKTEGRPLNANVELWQGPDNAPQKMSIYLEDGSLRPFRATIESPGSSNAVSIRNTGQMEFPLTAGLEVDASGANGPARAVAAAGELRTVQGGAVYTTPFPPNVQSVQVMLKSDGRPLNARVELLQGPNNNKQVMEVYTEDGSERPFYCVIDTPGSGNVVRIVNTATVEFPLSACIEPFIVGPGSGDSAAADGEMLWS